MALGTNKLTRATSSGGADADEEDVDVDEEVDGDEAEKGEPVGVLKT